MAYTAFQITEKGVETVLREHILRLETKNGE